MTLSPSAWPKPEFQEPNPSEVTWIANQLALAATFAGCDVNDELPALDRLDAAFAQLVESASSTPEQVNAAILMVGVALGTHLIHKLGFEWVIATDEYGTDLAVLARKGRGDITMYPVDFVTKRWERRETWFLAAVPGQVSESLAESDQKWASHGS